MRTGALANEERQVSRPADGGRRGGVINRPASAAGCAVRLLPLIVFGAGALSAGMVAAVERLAAASP